MKQDYMVFKNKNSLISCILLAITAGVIMFGISVIISMLHDWYNWIDNDINFRTFNLPSKMSDEEVRKIEGLNEVENIISPKEYSILATNAFLEDNENSNMYIEGLPDSELEKIIGKEVPDNDYIVCSDKFKPRNATIYYNDVDYISLKDIVGQNIELKFNNTSESILLAGLYKSELYYNDDDVCFASYKLVENLNEQYSKKEDYEYGNYHLLMKKDISNRKAVELLKENGYDISNIATVNNNSKDNIIKNVFFITLVLGIMCFLVTYMYILKYVRKYKNDEIFLQGLTAYALAIVVSFTGFLIFENYFLKNNSLFAKMDMTYSNIALIIGILVTFGIPIMINKTSKKKK